MFGGVVNSTGKGKVVEILRWVRKVKEDHRALRDMRLAWQAGQCAEGAGGGADEEMGCAGESGGGEAAAPSGGFLVPPPKRPQRWSHRQSGPMVPSALPS